jgi:hypothetical protein
MTIRRKLIPLYLVSAHEQRGWQSQAKHFGRPNVEDQLHLAGLLNRQVDGLRALEDAARIDAA